MDERPQRALIVDGRQGGSLGSILNKCLHFGPFSLPFRERVAYAENARRVHGSLFL